MGREGVVGHSEGRGEGRVMERQEMSERWISSGKRNRRGRSEILRKRKKGY